MKHTRMDDMNLVLQDELREISAHLKKATREHGVACGPNEKMVVVSVLPGLINKAFPYRLFDAKRYGFAKLIPLLKVIID